jgi:hypothetical protein
MSIYSIIRLSFRTLGTAAAINMAGVAQVLILNGAEEVLQVLCRELREESKDDSVLDRYERLSVNQNPFHLIVTLLQKQKVGSVRDCLSR